MTVEALRPSQVEFLEWATPRNGALLDGGMGVGKTRCAFELRQRKGAMAMLVKAPKSVLPAWCTQAEKYDPDLVVIAPRRGTVARRAEEAAAQLRAAASMGRPACVLINYEASIATAWSKFELACKWDLVVLDEVHRIKKPTGVTTRQCSKLRKRSGCMLGMTGTLMPHSPLDCFAPTRAVSPETFGLSWVAFRSRYGIMGGFEGHEIIGYRNLDEMRARLATVTFQIPRSILGLAVPTDVDLPVEMSSRALRAYADLERDLVARIDSGEITASNALVKLLRLQQITGGCVPVDDGGHIEPLRIDDAKEIALREAVLDSLPADEPVVVFARFRSDLDAVHRAAAACAGGPRASLELSGSRRELERWQAGEAPILAVQTQSGSVGIDLTRACIAVFYSTSWSLGEFDQARARIDRPPQARPVSFYHLIATDTVDVVVRKALDRRRDVVETVMADLRARRATPDINLRRSR